MGLPRRQLAAGEKTREALGFGPPVGLCPGAHLGDSETTPPRRGEDFCKLGPGPALPWASAGQPGQQPGMLRTRVCRAARLCLSGPSERVTPASPASSLARLRGAALSKSTPCRFPGSALPASSTPAFLSCKGQVSPPRGGPTCPLFALRAARRPVGVAGRAPKEQARGAGRAWAAGALPAC